MVRKILRKLIVECIGGSGGHCGNESRLINIFSKEGDSGGEDVREPGGTLGSFSEATSQTRKPQNFDRGLINFHSGKSLIESDCQF